MISGADLRYIYLIHGRNKTAHITRIGFVHGRPHDWEVAGCRPVLEQILGYQGWGFTVAHEVGLRATSLLRASDARARPTHAVHQGFEFYAVFTISIAVEEDLTGRCEDASARTRPAHSNAMTCQRKRARQQKQESSTLYCCIERSL